MSYADYIGSDVWRERRQRALEIAGSCCEFCGGENDPVLQVHHLSYERVGSEADADLIVLCWSCHEDVHAFPRVARAVRRFASRRSYLEAAA